VHHPARRVWLKFNDNTVSETTWDALKRESTGSRMNTSAYSLVNRLILFVSMVNLPIFFMCAVYGKISLISIINKLSFSLLEAKYFFDTLQC
jgi:hypothetical protein